MQCGTAPRAARDLTGEPCSPVNPFFLDGGFWLGEGASRELSGGVGGAFWLPEEQKASKPPTIFLWYRQAAPSLRRSRHGVIERRAASAASDAGSPCVGRPESIKLKGPPLRPAQWGTKENGGLEAPLLEGERSAAFGAQGKARAALRQNRVRLRRRKEMVGLEAPLLEGERSAAFGRIKRFGRACGAE